MPYDGFGAPLNDHYEVFPPGHYFPGTWDEPASFTVYCSCGGWSYESIASAGGGCDTNYMPWYEEHLEETE